jgi:hypothetical protein
MDWLDRELKTALARKDPPADFAERVQQAASVTSKPAVRPWPRLRQWPHSNQWPRWLAAAAAVAITAGAGMGYRQYRGEVARQQVMLAFRIASVKVNHIQAHVREAAR